MRLDRETWTQLLRGASLYGCGGGGSYNEARRTVRRLSRGKAVRLVSPKAKSAAGLALTVYPVGALSTRPPRKEAEAALRRSLDLYRTLFARGRSLAGLMPGEIGPGAVASCAAACAMLGVPMLDTDVVGGRSVPEITNELFSVYRRPKTPIVCGSHRGNHLVLLDVADCDLEERCRSFYQTEGKNIWVLGYATPVARLAEFLPIGTVSACVELGKRMWQKSFDPFTPVFEGTISKVSLAARGGFDRGTCRIRGRAGSATIHIKNENMVLQVGRRAFCTVPDLITVYSKQRRRGLASTELAPGEDVLVLCAKAHKRWRTARAVRFFNPRQQGLDFDVQRLAPRRDLPGGGVIPPPSAV